MSALGHADAAPRGTAGEAGWQCLTLSFPCMVSQSAGCLGTGPVRGGKCILEGTQKLGSSQNTMTAKCAFGHLGDFLIDSSLNAWCRDFGLAHSLICVLKEELQIKHFMINLNPPFSHPYLCFWA